MCFRHTRNDYKEVPSGESVLLPEPPRPGQQQVVYKWLAVDECDDRGPAPRPDLPYSATLDDDAYLGTTQVEICRVQDGRREALFSGFFRVRQ